jgi:hypothetical protein
MEYIMEKENIVNMLNQSWCEVTFTKKDGSNRVMICTRNSELIPELPTEGAFEPVSTKTIREEPVDVIRAYEQNVGWRSFKVDNLLSIVYV